MKFYIPFLLAALTAAPLLPHAGALPLRYVDPPSSWSVVLIDGSVIGSVISEYRVPPPPGNYFVGPGGTLYVDSRTSSRAVVLIVLLSVLRMNTTLLQLHQLCKVNGYSQSAYQATIFGVGT